MSETTDGYSIGNTETGEPIASGRFAETQSVTFTCEAMVPVDESRWQRVMRWALRRPRPSVAPVGTRPLVLETRDGDLIVRRYIPAARIIEPPV